MMVLVMRCGTLQVVETMEETNWATGTVQNNDYDYIEA